jgi:hypothetical protein
VTEAESIFRIIELSIAVIGIILVIFGWIIPYRQTLKTEAVRKESEAEAERVRWKKELVDQQISQLYGPIHALILEGNVQFSRILYQLGRRHIIPEGSSFYDLHEDEQKIWKHYVDTYKIRSQMKIVEIMRNNLHLVYNSELPTCYKDFLDYSLGWEMLDNQKRNGVPNYYEYHYIFNYPVEFNKYIKSTLEMLLNEQAILIKTAIQIPNVTT